MSGADRRRTHDIALRRLPSIRDSITVIWVEDSHLSSKDYDKIIARLNSLDNCFLVRYTALAKCIKYLKQARPYEHIILVLSINATDEESSIAAEDISQFDQYDQVQSTFILLPTNKNDIQGDTIKPTHVFHNYQSMFIKLQELIHEIQENNDTLFTLFNIREKAMRDVRRDLGPFFVESVVQT